MFNFLGKCLQLLNRCQWLGLFIARLSMGLFFAISGFYKLFNPQNKQVLLDTLIQAGIPFPHFNVIFVPLVELIVGFLLIIGFFGSLMALILFVLTLIAIFTDSINKLPDNLSFLPWLSYLLYLPEVLISIILFWLIFTGSGCLSADRLICKKMCQ